MAIQRDHSQADTQSRIRRAVAIVALLIAAAATSFHLAATRPTVGGVDFFFYLCNARDLLADPQRVADNAYRYFPGVYVFWSGVMAAVGPVLPRLQWAVLTVLLLNAALAAVVVYRCTRHGAAALFAALWYIALCTRYQGLEGVTEPLATAPYLAGLAIWSGRPLRGGGGVLPVCALAAGFGLALLAKQQGGLLSLGALWLLTVQLRGPGDQRHGWLALAALPLLSAAVFTAALLALGKGLEPLSRGLAMLGSYGSEGSWWFNLYVQVRADESAALAALAVIATLGWIVARRPEWVARPPLQVAGMAGLSGLAALLQFATRGYGHYSLLSAPCLAVAGTVLAAQWARQVLPGSRHPQLGGWLLVAAGAWLLLHPSGDPRALQLWRIWPSAERPSPLWHQQPQVARDLRQLDDDALRGQRLLVLPPRHNSVHFLLGSWSPPPQGYSFALPHASEVAWQQLDAVLLLSGAGLDESDRRLFSPSQRQRFEDELRRRGWRAEQVLPSMTLWRPASVVPP